MSAMSESAMSEQPTNKEAQRYWVTPIRFTEEYQLKWRTFGPMTKEDAKAIIKAEIERVNNMCVNIHDDDYNQKTFAGNATMTGLIEWFSSGHRAHLEDWKPISELKIKKISPNVLTLEP